MKNIQTAFFIAVLGLGVIFVGSSTANASPTSIVTPAQIVPAAKKIGKVTYKAGKRGVRAGYRGGRWVTVRVFSPSF